MPSIRYTTSNTNSSDYQVVKGDISISGNDLVASFVINDKIYTFPFTSKEPNLAQAILTYSSSMRVSGMQRFEARVNNGIATIRLNSEAPFVGMPHKPSKKTDNIRTEVGWMKGIPLGNSYPMA